MGAFDISNSALFVLMSMAFAYPLVMALAMSLSDAEKLSYDPIGLSPDGYSLNAYRMLLSDSTILRYYFNTVLYVFSGGLVPFTLW